MQIRFGYLNLGVLGCSDLKLLEIAYLSVKVDGKFKVSLGEPLEALSRSSNWMKN
jgi:hypothetical protein